MLMAMKEPFRFFITQIGIEIADRYSKEIMTIIKSFLKFVFLLYCFLYVGYPGISSAASSSPQSFQEWLNSFYSVASGKGITKNTYHLAFAGVTSPDERVLEKAAYQPEFTTEIWDYLDTRVTPFSVTNGRIMAAVYKRTLQDIESRFGVEPNVLLAIWSMESSYGSALVHSSRLYYVPRALATLAYADSRRKKFATSQLIAALKILQAGDVEPDHFNGSWAGAMGQTQFIPTSFLAYGVDMDGDGRRDIWRSVPDALATAANLLRKNKWRTGKSWGYEVEVPANGFRLQGKTKTIAQWEHLGFRRPKEAAFPGLGDNAELKMIAGETGPGFLMLKNFFVLKHYNNSDYYALAVGLLADRLAGKKGMIQPWPRPAGSLSVNEKIELQQLLQEKGLYSGNIDGYLGPNTQKGIKDFQQEKGLIPDGIPSLDVLESLRQ